MHVAASPGQFVRRSQVSLRQFDGMLRDSGWCVQQNAADRTQKCVQNKTGEAMGRHEGTLERSVQRVSDQQSHPQKGESAAMKR